MDGMRGRLPLAPAVLAAVVARDELRQLDLADLDLDATFTVDEARLEAIATALDAVSDEIVENVRMGFPLGALLDMLACSDARILKSVADLIEAGVLKR
jgi:hypothetical protein